MALKFIEKVEGFDVPEHYAVRESECYPNPTNPNKWRARVKVADIKKDLMEYGNKCHTFPDDIALKCAISITATAFKLPNKVKMLHICDFFKCEDPDIWNKSPGLPWLDMGYDLMKDIRDDFEAIQKIRHFWHRIKNREKLSPPDCIALGESGVCPVGEKRIRAIWSYPATMSVGEAVFAVPLIEAYRDTEGPMGYKYDMSPAGAKQLYNRFQNGYKYTKLDFRFFYKTVPSWLIDKAFLVLLQNIDIVHFQGGGIPDASKMYHMYNYLKYYFINTSIRTSNGLRFRKSNGIPCGSYFSHLIGSICNYILCQWVCLKQGTRIQDIVVMNDDSFLSTGNDISLSAAKRLLNSIGMDLNMETCQTTTHLNSIKYLGFRLGDGVPYKEHEEWMTMLLFPERADRQLSELQSRAWALYHAARGRDAPFARVCTSLIRAAPFHLSLPPSFKKELHSMGVPLDVLNTESPHDAPLPTFD